METPCNGNPSPRNGNSWPVNGNPLRFVETIFEKQGIIICGNHFEKQGMFEKKNPVF